MLFLYESNLIYKDKPAVILQGADLINTNLSGVYLSNTNLSRANLVEANLSDVEGVTDEELEQAAYSLTGATMPDGSIHD